MFRKKLIDLLLDRPMSVREIALVEREPPRDIVEDLRHLLISLKHTEFQAIITAAHCRKCGFEFDTNKLTKPSKCPECQSTWITEPRVCIEQKPGGTSSSHDADS